MAGRAGQLLGLFVRFCYSIVFFCAMALSLYSICDMVYLYTEAAGKSAVTDPEGSETDGDGQTKWPDGCVARIRIENTGIDYPVMQGNDNTTYLNLDEEGEYSLSGSIFLDCRCSPQFNDGYSLIYGHHMEYGLMFGALDRFRDGNYFDGHRDGTLTLRDGKSVRFSAFALAEVPSECPEVFEKPFSDPGSEEDFSARKEWIRAHASVYRDPETGGTNRQIIALSTCSGEEGNRREILFCCRCDEG